MLFRSAHFFRMKHYNLAGLLSMDMRLVQCDSPCIGTGLEGYHITLFISFGLERFHRKALQCLTTILQCPAQPRRPLPWPGPFSLPQTPLLYPTASLTAAAWPLQEPSGPPPGDSVGSARRGCTRKEKKREWIGEETEKEGGRGGVREGAAR